MPSSPRAVAAAALLGGAVAALLPAGAMAQPAPDLPPTIVTAPAIPPPPTTVPDNAAREAEFREIPGNVSVVPAREFRDRPAVTTLRDALQYTPGVFAEPKWGEDSRLSIRGSGLARNFHLRGVRLYQDFMPISQADGSGDFQELDPLTAYRLEVLPGGNAFFLGANTLGGAINLVTPTGRLAPGALLRGEAGSYGFIRGQMAYGAATDRADAYITGTALYQDGYRNHSAARSYRLNGNAAARWGADTAETRVYVSYNDIWQLMPGTVTRSTALDSPRTANPANVLNNYQRNIRSTRVGSITTFRPRDGVRIDIGGSFVDRELDHPIFQYIDQRNNDVNAFIRARVEGALFGLPSVTYMGGNFAYGATASLRYLNILGRPGALTYASDDKARTADAYFETRTEVRPGLQLIGGLQVGQAMRSSLDQYLVDGNQSGAGNWQWINSRIGLLWEVAPGAQVFGNLTGSTEPPTLSDLLPLVAQGGFNRLKPQTAYTLEMGTRGERGDLSWSVTLYRAWLKDEIQLFTVGATGASFALNADRTVHQGIEAAMRWTMLRNTVAEGDSLTLTQAYTLSDFFFRNDPVWGNDTLPGAPPQVYRAELRYRHPSGTWIAPITDWVPNAFFVDNANTLKTDAYALVGLRGGWNFENGLMAFFEARNLANTRYISSASVIPRALPNSPLFEPGFGRAIYGGLQFTF